MVGSILLRFSTANSMPIFRMAISRRLLAVVYFSFCRTIGQLKEGKTNEGNMETKRHTNSLYADRSSATDYPPTTPP